MGREVLKKFDRYFLLDRIAQGGMAEIYRSRLASIDSGNRLLVIKRIHAGFDENKDFIKMFRSEIRVMMGFNHPNIVQLYDFGEANNQPFIAMEFIDGRNLRQLVTKMTENEQTFPVDLAVHIIEIAASGLHYAHNYKDKLTGESMHIIHRDVSPQNILISYDGNVKLIDFGIAKATTNVDSTRVGIIKGKPSYLSPEQVMGKKIDRRSDLFALGILLWESLTGRKLFSKDGDNEFAVLKLIENANKFVKPPSKYNPTIPAELDKIVLRSLAKEPEKRFQTAEEFQRTLRKLLNSISPDLTSSDLAFAVKNAFKDQIIEDRRWLRRLNEKAERLLISQKYDQSVHFNEDHSTKERKGDQDDPTFISKKPGKLDNTGADNRLKIDEKSDAVIEIESNLSPITSRARARAAGTKSISISRQQIKQQRSFNKPKGGNFIGKLVWAVSLATIGLIYFGDPTLILEIKNGILGITQKNSEKEQKITKVEKTKTIQTQKKIVLNLELPSGPGRTLITINGKRLPSDQPRARVPFNKTLRLVVEREKYQRYKKEFTLDSKDYLGLEEWSMKVPLVPKAYGYFTLYSTPSGEAKIYQLDSSGRKIASENPWVFNTPEENFKIPAGKYRVELKNKVLGMENSFMIRVKAGYKIKKDVRLKIK